MMEQKQKALKKLVLASAVASIFALTGCGGGGGGSSSSSAPSSSATLSGTVAGGAAVVGTVIVTDSAGTTKSATIEANGHYSIDVSGMAGPFVLKAAGTVGGTHVTYYSAAVTADINGTVNVTPYTDLMVSNIAGQLADAYFANGAHLPSGTLITASVLASAQSALQAKLAPALQAMGLSATIDLLRASFAADHTGLDAALDVIKVDNSSSNVSIVNTLTGLSIAHDDVTITSDNSTPASLSGADTTALGSATTDLQAVQAALNSVQTLFATSMPTPTQLQNSGVFDTSGNFVDGGKGFSLWATDVSTDSAVIGITFSNVAITLDSTTTGWVNAKITLTNGVGGELKWKLAKINGIWKIQGDQHIVDVSIEPRATQNIPGNGQGQTTTISGLQMWIDTSDYTGTAIASAVVTGPGLPNGGVTMVPSPPLPFFLIQGGSTGTTIPECLNGATTQCVNIANTVDNGQYNVVLKDAGANSLNGTGYTLTLNKKPLVTSTLTAGMFPTLTSPTVNGSPLTSLSQVVANANLGATMVLPSGYAADHLSVEMWGGGGTPYLSVGKKSFSSTSVTLNVGSSIPSPVNNASIYLMSMDSLNRGFATDYYY